MLIFVLAFAPVCAAHVGSPDVYFQGDAGPYHLVVMVRTPQMIPGVAEIEIRSDTPGIREVKIVPLYIVGEGSKYPPPPDVVNPVAGDPQFFAGKLWLMASGSWQVRIEADGDKGSGTVAVPVPAFARNTLAMQRGLGILLFGLMLLLVIAIVSIVGAANREGALKAGRAAYSAAEARGPLGYGGDSGDRRRNFGAGESVVECLGRQSSHPDDLCRAEARRELDPTGRMSLEIGESKWHSLAN